MLTKGGATLESCATFLLRRCRDSPHIERKIQVLIMSVVISLLEWGMYLSIVLAVLSSVLTLGLYFSYRKKLNNASTQLAQVSARLTRLFEHCGDAIVIFDSEGRVTSWNRAASRLYGWSEKSVLGKVLPMIQDNRREHVLERLTGFYEKELVVNRDTLHLTSSGEAVELNVTWTSILGESGDLECLMLVARDISAVRSLEKELMTLNEQLSSLTMLAKLFSGSSDLRGTVETAVAELMRSLHIAYCMVDSVVSEHGELIPTLRLGQLPDACAFQSLMTVAEAARMTRETVQDNLVVATPIRVLDKHVGSIAVWFEETDFMPSRVKVLETFANQLSAVVYTVGLLYKEREAADKIRQLNAMRGDFVAMVSHELRTPLTCIKGFVDTMLRTDTAWSKEDIREFLESIKISTNQALLVVDDLLTTQKSEHGKLIIVREPCDLLTLISDACRRAQATTSAHSIAWSVPSVCPAIYADSMRITQVMDNLLSNAIKYSPLGGEILVRVKTGQSEVEISVMDNGVGIPVEQQELVFEKFYRVDNTAARRAEGLGLGLSIVKTIVNLHGGRVWVESTPGRGSTFYVTLPSQG